MHEEVLTAEQKNLLPLIGSFADNFGLVGGTAIALLIGHRKSIDFDLATINDFNHETARNIIRKKFAIQSTLVENPMELTLVANSVKLTFMKYPFPITFPLSFGRAIKMPDISTLGAMKAFALGRRAKWKDYVDLYYIFKEKLLSEITRQAESLFGGEFNEKLFREELAYFKDIDYSEKIDYLPGFKVDDETVKEGLSEISLRKE